MYYSSSNFTISSISAAVPSKKLNREDFKKIYGEDLEKKLFLNSGVETRYFANEDQSTINLSVKLAKEVFKKNQINPDELDALIFITQSTDFVLPGGSFIIHKELNLNSDCLCVDYNVGCSAYPIGLFQASLLFNNPNIKKILLIIGDTLSKYLDKENRGTYCLFGDGVSLTILENKKINNQSYFNIKNDGKGYEDLIVKEKILSEKKKTLHMNGMGVFSFAIKQVPEMIADLQKKYQLENENISYLILHQANKNIIDIINKQTNFSNKSLISISDFGNTASASIPITICHNKKFLQNKNINCLLVGFGVGLSWSSCQINFSNTNINDIFYY